MPERRITRRSLYSWVLGRNTRLQLLLLCIILVTVAARIFPLEMQKRVVNVAIAMKDFDALVLYCGLYIGAVILAGVLKYVINVLQSYIGQRTLVRIRGRLFEHILSLPVEFFRRTSPGHVISSLVQELAPIGEFIGMALAVPLVNVLTFVGMAGYMFYLNPLLGAISVAIYPIDFMVLPYLQRRFNRHNRARLRRMRDMSAMVGESVTGVHEVHSNGSIPVESRKFGQHIDALFKTNIMFSVYKFGIKFANNFFQNLGPFFLFLVGGWLAIRGRFDLGALVAFLSAYEKLYDPWKELIEFYQAYQDSRVRYKQVMDTFDITPEHALTAEGREPYTLHGAVEMREVSFVVDGNIRLLDGISLSLRQGEHLALVGFSGSGKSTLALVLAQLYAYSGGNVLIDGKELAQLSRQDVVFNIGVVAQHPFIFGGTVRENIVYSCDALRLQGGSCGGQKEPDLDRIIEVVQQVGLFLDVLRFGTRTVMDAGTQPELTTRIIHARQLFHERYREELSRDIEFFDPTRFLRHVSVADNVVFGAYRDVAFAPEDLPHNAFFREFLRRHELEVPLVRLGRDIAVRTVEVLRSTDMSDDVFEASPISRAAFDGFTELVDRLGRARSKGAQADDAVQTLAQDDRVQLLGLALSFVPGLHRIMSLPAGLEERILAARPEFMRAVEEGADGAFAFYRPEDYIPTLSILDNILYGRIMTESAGGEERIQQAVMRLLIEEGILEQVVAMGLEFQVGSMGDRLSGGQRQKIALARAFLKEPPVLILDEATSALDNASQSRIQNLLQDRWKGRSTLVAVVHRLDTLKGYDTVAVMKAGRIVEKGPYEELMEQKGALYELVHGK